MRQSNDHFNNLVAGCMTVIAVSWMAAIIAVAVFAIVRVT